MNINDEGALVCELRFEKIEYADMVMLYNALIGMVKGLEDGECRSKLLEKAGSLYLELFRGNNQTLQ